MSSKDGIASGRDIKKFTTLAESTKLLGQTENLVYDLAIPLNNLKFSKLSNLQKKEVKEAFFEGYAEEYTLPQKWLDMVDGFIRLRII